MSLLLRGILIPKLKNLKFLMTQSTEDGEINDTSDILIISVDSNDTSIISDDSEKVLMTQRIKRLKMEKLMTLISF